MKRTSSGRRGLGIPTIIAAILPVIILVGALALSTQSSLARRSTITLWTSYVALDVAEGAIAEASHVLKLEHVFDPMVFKPVYDLTSGPTPTSFPVALLGCLAKDYKSPPVPDPLREIPEANREYRTITNKTTGQVKWKMLTAFRFPDRGWLPVAVPGLVKEMAKKLPEVVSDGTDLTVEVNPATFRREYYQAPGWGTGTWVNWGVVQFRVKVKTREIQGSPVVREIRADRRFSLPPAAGGSTEVFNLSTVNLRTSVTRVE